MKLKIALLFLLSVLLHVPGALTLPLMDRDEPRFAEASREMRERRNYIVPYFNNEERFHKPPLIYWLQVASYSWLGENDFAARFPSVIAAALTALLIFGFGWRLYDEKTAFWAAVSFSVCVQTLILAKAAVADMPMVFFVTLASWAGWEVCREKRPFGFWWWVFYTALALGFLAKGPVAWIPLGAVGLFAFWSRLGGMNKIFRIEAGALIVIFLVGLWGFPALLQTHGEFLKVGIGQHVIGRSFHVMEGHGPKDLLAYFFMLPFYFVTIFFSFFPWSLFLPGMFFYFKKKESRGEKEIYLLSSIFLFFIIFTPLKTKLPHYTYPAFPLLALLFAAYWVKVKVSAAKLARITAFMFVISFSFSFLGTSAGAFCSPPAELARKSAAWLKPEMEFASVDYHEPSLVWYFRKWVRGFHYPLEADEAARFMKRQGPRFCVLPTKRILEIFPVPDPAWKIVEAQGINLAKGRWADLSLLIKGNG